MSFRINSQTIGLTYPTSKLTINSIHDWLNSEFSNYHIKHCCVARELHQSGEQHFHVALRLGRPFNSRDERFGDFSGEHPNILRPRNYSAWVAYCKKDGDFRESGSEKDVKPRNNSISQEQVAEQARTLSKVDFLIWAGVNRITYAKDIWDLSNNNLGITINAGDTFQGIISPCLMNLKFSLEWLGPKALILIGDSGVGKTTWAKTNIPKPCLFVTHIDELRCFRENFHKSILFDDVSFKHYPIQAQIHLVDFFDPRTIHVRYATAKIPAGTIKFYTCNEDPLDLQHPAIKRRTKVIRIIEPIGFNNCE